MWHKKIALATFEALVCRDESDLSLHGEPHSRGTDSLTTWVGLGD